MVEDERIQLNERMEFESQYYKVPANAQGLLSEFKKSYQVTFVKLPFNYRSLVAHIIIGVTWYLS